MRGRQRRAELADQIDHPGQRQRRLGAGLHVAQDRAQRPARHLLHRDEEVILVLAEVVDPADVGVRDPAGQADLTAQPLPVLGVVRQLAAQQLQRDPLVELEVVDDIDDAHAAFTEQLEDAVAAGQQRARHDLGGAVG